MPKEITQHLNSQAKSGERDRLASSNKYATYGGTEYSNIDANASSQKSKSMDIHQSKQNGSLTLNTVDKSESEHEENGVVISNKRRRILFVTMALMDMSGGLMFGMIGPFFPSVAKEKNATPFLSGVVMGSFEFTMIFAAPIMGNFIARIGVRYAYTAGIMLAGACSIIFGALYWCPDNWFIPLCVIVRVLQGTGFAAFVTSSYAILIHLFTKDMASVFGVLETMKGVGFMIGPVLGSGLYAVGGYMAPFLTLGTCVLVAGASVSCIIPQYKIEKKKSEVSVWSLFKIPMEFVCGLIHAALAYMFSNFDATFGLHLEQFNLKPIYVGLLFFAIAAGYCITSPIMGKITDTWPNMAYIFVLVGFTLCGCSILMAGPAPFLPLPSDNLVLLAVSVTLVGVFASTAVVTFTIMFSVARLYDFPDNIDTYGKISGFVEGLYNSGAFIGPMIGGLAYQNLGWGWSFSICAFVFFFCNLLLFILLIWQKIYKGMDFTSGLDVSKYNKEDTGEDFETADTLLHTSEKDTDQHQISNPDVPPEISLSKESFEHSLPNGRTIP